MARPDRQATAVHPSETVGEGNLALLISGLDGEKSLLRPRSTRGAVLTALLRTSFPIGGLARVAIAAWTNVAGRAGFPLAVIVKE